MAQPWIATWPELIRIANGLAAAREYRFQKDAWTFDWPAFVGHRNNAAICANITNAKRNGVMNAPLCLKYFRSFSI